MVLIKKDLYEHKALFLTLVVFLAVVVRIALAPSDVTPVPGSDGWEYDSYAWSLAQGHGYCGPAPGNPNYDHPTSWRMPGPSLVYAAGYRVFGHRARVAVCINILASALTCIPLFLLALRIFNERVAFLATAIFAIWPHSVYLSGTLLSESLYTLVLATYALHCIILRERPTLRHIVSNGLLLGLLLYIRPHVLLIPFLAVWVAIVFWPEWRKVLVVSGIFLIAAIMLLPWIIRNYQVHGRFVPFTTQGGEALLQGANRIVATDPEWAGLPYETSVNPDYKHLFVGLSEVERSDLALRLYREWMREHPDQRVQLPVKKLRRFWSPFLHQKNLRNRLLMALSWGPVLVLFPFSFFYSLYQHGRTKHPGLILHCVILSTALNAVIFSGLVRYRFPIECFCLVFACATATWLAHHTLWRKDSVSANTLP